MHFALNVKYSELKLTRFFYMNDQMLGTTTPYEIDYTLKAPLDEAFVISILSYFVFTGTLEATRLAEAR